jgi:hypothetical protein
MENALRDSPSMFRLASRKQSGLSVGMVVRLQIEATEALPSILLVSSTVARRGEHRCYTVAQIVQSGALDAGSLGDARRSVSVGPGVDRCAVAAIAHYALGCQTKEEGPPPLGPPALP